MVKVPCKDCNKRAIGCHSTCAEYKEYLTNREKGKAQITKARGELYGFDSYEKDKIKRLSKYKQ